MAMGMANNHCAVLYDDPSSAEFVKEEHNYCDDIGNEGDVSGTQLKLKNLREQSGKTLQVKDEEDDVEVKPFEHIFIPQENNIHIPDINVVNPLAINKEDGCDQPACFDAKMEVRSHLNSKIDKLVSQTRMSRKVFTFEEKKALKALIVKYGSVMENKKSDCVSVRQKKCAWEQITKVFNQLPGTSNRTAEQLKKCWENMKNRKDALVEMRRCRMGTRGGKILEIGHDPILDHFLKVFDVDIQNSVESDTAAFAQNGGNYTYQRRFPVAPNDTLSNIEPTATLTTTVAAAATTTTTTTIATTATTVTTTAGESFTPRSCQALTRGSMLQRELEARILRSGKGLEMDIQAHNARKKQEEEIHNLKIEQMKDLHQIKRKHLLRMNRLELLKARRTDKYK